MAYRLRHVAAIEGRRRHSDVAMIGRQRELEVLRQSFERVVSGRRCQLFTILGAAGVGKSRLVAEFLRDVQDRARVLSGRCLPYGEGITYWPIAEIVRAAAKIPATDSRDVALERLNTLMAADGDDRVKIVDLLAGAIGLGPSSGTPEETAWAVRRLFVRLATQKPLVVVVDDVHWAAPALLDLLEGAVDWIQDVPLMVLCVARQELLERRPTWGGGKLNATSLLVEPLSMAESESLIGELLGGGAVPPDVVQRASHAADGNPLFVEEYVAMLLDEGRLIREGDGWSSTRPLDDLQVPATVSALLAARLDRLDERKRQLLEIAAVQGMSFSAGALENLITTDDDSTLTETLMALVRMELIQPDGIGPAGREAFRFRHILLRDAAYAPLPKAERGRFHGQFADWLASVAGDRLDEYEEIIGYHLEQAWRYHRDLRRDDPQLPELAGRAATHLAAAGGRAQGRGDLDAAIGLFERAVALGPPDQGLLARLLVDLGATLGELGTFAPALEALARAEDIAKSGNLDAPAAMATVELFRIRLSSAPVGWTADATLAAEAAIRAFEAVGDDRGLARAWHLIGVVDVMRARADGMLEAFSRAGDYAVRAGDARLEADSRVWMATALFLGPTPVPQALEQCLALLEPAGLRAPVEAGIRTACAGLRAMAGDFSSARADVAKASEITATIGAERDGRRLQPKFAMVEMLAGDVAAAVRYLREGLETLERMGEIGFRSTGAGLLSYVLFDAGDPAGRGGLRGDVVGARGARRCVLAGALETGPGQTDGRGGQDR